MPQHRLSEAAPGHVRRPPQGQRCHRDLLLSGGRVRIREQRPAERPLHLRSDGGPRWQGIPEQRRPNHHQHHWRLREEMRQRTDEGQTKPQPPRPQP